MADGTVVKPILAESCADTCCHSTLSALSLTSERRRADFGRRFALSG